MPVKIFLIGYRATGKTGAGKSLAKTLGCDFWDLDERIMAKEGASVKEMVSSQGWKYFRQRERAVLKEAVSAPGPMVVACGGGAVMHEDLWPEIKRSSMVVWLRARPETILKRLGSDPDTDALRPALIQSKTLKEEVESTLAARGPLYKKWADHEIWTDGRRIGEIVAELTHLLQRSRQKDRG